MMTMKGYFFYSRKQAEHLRASNHHHCFANIQGHIVEYTEMRGIDKPWDWFTKRKPLGRWDDMSFLGYGVFDHIA